MELIKIQQLFLRYILHGEYHPSLDKLIKGNIINPMDSLNIYRNNTFISLQECLKSTFPVSQQILGEKFFTQATKKYIVDFPPTNGCLTFYGESFSRFLSSLIEIKNLPYIIDVASFEYAMHQSFYAEDYPVLTAEDLTLIPAEKYGDLVLNFQPSFQFVQSFYPIDYIWSIHNDHSIEQMVELKIIKSNNLENYLVYRLNNTVYFQKIDQDEAGFIQHLKEGMTFEKAFSLIYTIYPNFNLTKTIQRLIQFQVLTSYNT
jgi:hypothetical protein